MAKTESESRVSPANPEAPAAQHWAALLIAIIASQAGQVLLKLGASGLPPMEHDLIASLLAQMLRWQTLIGLCCYGSGTMFYVVALRRIPMSVAAPCTAVSYVSATLFGMLLFHETLSLTMLAGLALVCLGVVLLAEIGGKRGAAKREAAEAGLSAPGRAVSASP
ncbi:EamA-like transporter family protein [Dankookia rubra]|uniref:EamA-like transporter family protein n=1 Tax=Dankookia rubra TaxID=1442381 RepID=A0A4R5Q8N4_9PROT|nr:EamA-like transporter family protein [Dankookia rubra]